MQDDPIPFISGTAFFFSVHATTAEKLDISVACTQLCHFEVLQREEAYILEALLFSKQFESPKPLAAKLKVLIDHSQEREEWSSLFTLRSIKNIIGATEKKFRCTTEVYEQARLQSFLLCEELLRHCQLLLTADSYEMLSKMINCVFQNRDDSREWFVKQWRREQIHKDGAMSNGLHRYLEQAAEHFHFGPRQALWDSGLKIADALTNHVGVIISGKPGSGKTTSYRVLMKAFNLARLEIFGCLQDTQSDSTASKRQPHAIESDHNSVSKGSMRLLERSMSKTEPVKVCLDDFAVTHVILPMALSLTQLYGTISQDGKGRIQSILGCLIRDAQETCCPSQKRDSSDTQEIREHNLSIPQPLLTIFGMQAFHLVVFDGCLSQTWTESLMCVLGRKPEALAMDTSEELTRRVLCFEDGEFMSVPPNLRFAFESLSLDNASPSFITLNAIVCHDANYSKASVARSEKNDTTIPISYLRRSLQRQRHSALKSSLESSFVNIVFDHVSEWLLETDLIDSMYSVIEEYKPSVHLSQLQRVTYLLSLLQALLHSVSVVHFSRFGIEPTPISQSPNVTSDPVLIRVQMAIINALMWGFASCTTENTSLQLLLNGWIKKRFESISSSWSGNSTKDVNLFNTVMDLSSMRFIDVLMIMIECKPDPIQQSVPSNANIFIPTASSFLVHSVMKEVMRTGRGVLLVGGDNARKTTLLKSFLGQLDSLKILPALLMSTRRNSRKKSAVSKLTEQSHLQNSESTGRKSTASLDKIRLHQVSLVSMLATKFKRLASAHKELSISTSTIPSSSASEEASSQPGLIMPTMNPKQNETINKFDQGEFIPFFISMNRHDRGVEGLSKCLERVLQRERNGVYEPPPGKTVILIIDDLHLPVFREDDSYPSSHEYLRSVYEHSVVYANDNAKKITIESLMLAFSITTENMPGDCGTHGFDEKRSTMDKLVRQLFPVLAPPISLQELHQIFSARIVSEWENSKNSGTRLIRSVQQIIPLVIAGTTVLWEKIRRTMLSQQVAMPLRSRTGRVERMLFKLHDLSRIYDGLCCVESSFLVDSATLIRLWNHECIRSFTDQIPSPQMNALDIAQDIFRMRDVIEAINQRQESQTTAYATANNDTSVLLSADQKSLADPSSEKQLSTLGLLAMLSAEFLEKKPSKVDVKSQSGSKKVSHHLADILSSTNTWGFVPSQIYYQATSQEQNQNFAKQPKKSNRQSSIKFMRQKSMSGALSNRWIYAELLPEDTPSESIDIMNQVFFSAMQTFSTIYTPEYRVGSSLSITSSALQAPSDAPKIPHSMVNDPCFLSFEVDGWFLSTFICDRLKPSHDLPAPFSQLAQNLLCSALVEVVVKSFSSTQFRRVDRNNTKTLCCWRQFLTPMIH